MKKEILNKFVDRFDKLSKEPLAVTRKDNACIKCNNVISDNFPFISRGGDTYCVVCHHFLCEKEKEIEAKQREIDYNNRNICLRCNVKSDGPFLSDRETDRPICLKCVKIGESGYTYNVL